MPERTSDPQVIPYLLYADAGARELGEVTQVQCITVADVPAHRDRARAAGADVSEISIRAGQARTYTVDDPEGHRWFFGEPL